MLTTGLGGASIGKDVFLSADVSFTGFDFTSGGSITFASLLCAVIGPTAGFRVSFQANAATAINTAAEAIQTTLRDFVGAVLTGSFGAISGLGSAMGAGCFAAFRAAT